VAFDPLQVSTYLNKGHLNKGQALSSKLSGNMFALRRGMAAGRVFRYGYEGRQGTLF
jgi:hypothetical protein